MFTNLLIFPKPKILSDSNYWKPALPIEAFQMKALRTKFYQGAGAP